MEHDNNNKDDDDDDDGLVVMDRTVGGRQPCVTISSVLTLATVSLFTPQ